MFGGVLNSLTKKLGQTATKGEVGKLAGLVGGEGAIAKSAPKITEQLADQIIYHGTPNPNKLPLNESVPEEALAYLGGGAGNDLLKYMNATNPEFVAKKNLGAKTKTPAPKGRPTNEIRDSIAGTKIHPDDMDAMDEFIRYARNKKLRNSLPDDKQAKYELRMYDMADHYGIKLNENATDPIRDMANKFIKAMDKQNLGGK